MHSYWAREPFQNHSRTVRMGLGIASVKEGTYFRFILRTVSGIIHTTITTLPGINKGVEAGLNHASTIPGMLLLVIFLLKV